MSSMKDKLLLVFYHDVILLLLTWHCGGQSQMIGPTQPLVAMTGDDIILPCQLEPARDAVDLTVEWSRRDLKPRFVHLKRDDAELLTQNALYSRRTSLSINKLKCGDISLKLSKVQVSDAGMYNCLVPEIGAETGMELVVGSVSSVVVEIFKVKNEIFFKCKSNGWYPEPQVFWLNSQGNQITAESTNSAKGSDGLYTVSSTVTVSKRQTYSLTCRVQQKNINQIEEAHMHVSGEFYLVQCNPAVQITINLAVCLIVIVTTVLLIWKCGQKKTKIRIHDEDVNELHQTEMEEKLQRECEEKKRLEDELQNNEEDLKHVRQTIEKLMEQKTFLKNQREKLITLLQEDKTEMKEAVKKLEIEPKTDREKRMQKRGDKKVNLEKRTEVHEELLKMTEKLMEETENIIIQMTERKGKLEKDKEQIIKHLREKQRNERDLEETVRETSEKH
ncbi:butyrophilin subfamily 3 member A2 [Oreochromis niloticus]|uniref:butyrophilin subfamily 3 member A2 n=1 Tax=Oreochromis niloticus TaxID=8128 RepID=UPI00090502EB|nr:butyrophilin subfamily 3 member A2 [Oreochromis niloticus]XP_019209421.1 butyrophilin subfamily 3 member A2 [Oreochromis niloticus]XP_019209422.1 butyrophilin subfamily 3 member A2 [Oreochromis niloticus]XP_039458497.1 butyrophilin subfamily 3 member A2-like [Oreochromis aureus]